MYPLNCFLIMKKKKKKRKRFCIGGEFGWEETASPYLGGLFNKTGDSDSTFTQLAKL